MVVDKIALAGSLLRIFRGREDVIAVQSASGDAFRPVEISSPIQPEWFSDHLDSEKQECLGFYLLTKDNSLFCTALDFDNHNNSNPQAFEQAKTAYHALLDLGLRPLFECSQSATGFHVWLAFDGTIDSKLVYNFWKALIARHELPAGTEQYPRQSSLDGLKKSLGSLIRYPLHNKSLFMLSDNGIINELPLDQTAEYLNSIQLTTHEEFTNVCLHWGVTAETSNTFDLEDFGDTDSDVSKRVRKLLVENPSSLLAARWRGEVSGLSDASNSGLLCSIATELVRSYVPTNEIEQAIRYWGELHGYDKCKRDDFIERTLSKAYSMVVNRAEQKSIVGHTFSELAHSYADKVLNNEEKIIPTGIQSVDASFLGVGAGEYCVVSARPNQGKTAFTMSWIDHAAMLGYPCMLISLEMSPEENSRRILLRVSNISSKDWKTEEGNQKLHDAINDHYRNRAPIYFIDGAESIDRIDQLIDQYCEDYKVQFVVVDYQGLIDGGKMREYENQTEISKRLKKAARRNSVAVVSLVQMNRDTDDEDRPPRLNDLKGSGEIESASDLVLFLRWPWKLDPSAPRDVYEVYALKCRNRGIESQLCICTFNDSTQTFH